MPVPTPVAWVVLPVEPVVPVRVLVRVVTVCWLVIWTTAGVTFWTICWTVRVPPVFTAEVSLLAVAAVVPDVAEPALVPVLALPLVVALKRTVPVELEGTTVAIPLEALPPIETYTNESIATSIRNI